ncbi:hypothetical protein CKAH01_16151 [Colletotrichum kahawae]|uniref:Uncharacterized protein n=1 Tax=Colletotrichum kahawae TaxID=34407 RepID=A0AAD9YH64_COLKA|nr:hypothetical protein CKAH01_16151 [Colletotrichum kahawae]
MTGTAITNCGLPREATKPSFRDAGDMQSRDTHLQPQVRPTSGRESGLWTGRTPVRGSYVTCGGDSFTVPGCH